MRMKVVEFTTRCPYCGDTFPLATSIREDEAVPKSGDISLCFTCGRVSIFDISVAGGARPPNEQEATEIAADGDVIRAMLAWREMRDAQR